VSDQPPFDSVSHDAPLVHLVANLEHLKGTSLRDRVVRLRWRRRKVRLAGDLADTNAAPSAAKHEPIDEVSYEPANDTDPSTG
jgi:hypothetical protein